MQNTSDVQMHRTSLHAYAISQEQYIHVPIITGIKCVKLNDEGHVAWDMWVKYL